MQGRLCESLFSRASGAGLGVVRISFGLIMLYESCWFIGLTPNSPFTWAGARSPLANEPLQWSFTYPFFQWAAFLPAGLTVAGFAVMAAASVCVTLGILYRPAMLAVFCGFTVVNLSDSSFYLNHFYLTCVVAFLLIWMPADRRFALRNVIRRSDARRDLTVPYWTMFLLRAQVFMVYFFAGVEKINSDWLVGEPLRRWLPHPTTAGRLSVVLSDSWMAAVRDGLSSESAVMFLSYAGLVFDISIGFFLIYRRTRVFAFGVAVLFHAANFLLFDIGVFPFLATALTTLFFDPDWPDRLIARFRNIGIAAANQSHFTGAPDPTLGERTHGNWRQRTVATLIAAWLLLQIGVAVRHYFIPGNASWTEEGHRFSWRMKLRNKDAGPFRIELVDPARSERGPQGERDPSAWTYRQVDAGHVPWMDLPAVVMIYEPLLGERIVVNPLAGQSWLESADVARRMWKDAYGTNIKLKRTWPLRAALSHLQRELESANRNGDESAKSTLLALGQLRRFHQALRSTRTTAAEQIELQMAFQDSLYRLAHHPSWRQTVLTALMQTHPFACQSAGDSNVPFMIAWNPEVVRPGKDVCFRIERNNWPGSKQVLIDYKQLTPRALGPLPEIINFVDFDGRNALFWNETHELIDRQAIALRRSSLLQQQYAHHIADRYQQMFASRPKVFVTSYVKLNQHPMQLMVESSVDLAAEPRKWIGHNSWILPMVRAEDSRAEHSVAWR